MIQKQTERMSAALLLDDATSAKFAPVYQQYLKDLSDIRKEARQDCPAAGAQCQKAEKKALTDAEIEARIEQRFDRCRKMLDTREKYYKESFHFTSPIGTRQPTVNMSVSLYLLTVFS